VLAFHRAIGIDTYPTTSGVVSFLAAPVTPPPATPAAARPGRAPKDDTQPTLPPTDSTLEEIRNDLGNCQRCALKEGRNHLVFGTGPARASLCIVGEWPDPAEDREGSPFAGESGALLDRMLAAIGLSRDQIYLTNIVKCRPPADRPPLADEVRVCLPFLTRQIAVVSPKVIVAMGPLACQTLLHSNQPLSRLRGRWHKFHGIDLMPTFHPAFLLANLEMKKASWLDLQLIQKRCAKP